METREKLPNAFMDVEYGLFDEMPLSEEEEKNPFLITLAFACALDQWTKEESQKNNDWIGITYTDIWYAATKVYDEYLIHKG